MPCSVPGTRQAGCVIGYSLARYLASVLRQQGIYGKRKASFHSHIRSEPLTLARLLIRSHHSRLIEKAVTSIQIRVPQSGVTTSRDHG